MRVDRGFNLYVDITAACNASCPFCIAPTIGRKDGPDFFDGLAWALDFTEKHNGSVQVTGGEPSLSRRLPQVLSMIQTRRFHRKVFNTNGCGVTEETVAALINAGFHHVNLSRHHYDERKNQEVMRIRPEILAGNDTFVRAIDIVQRSGIVARVNCNLLSGYIDSFGEMVRFADWCASLGLSRVSFSEIFPLSSFDHQTPIGPGYTESHHVALAGIVREADDCWKSVREQRMEAFSVWGHSTWIGSFVEGGHRRFWQRGEAMEVSIKTLAGWNADGSPKEPHYDKEADPELQPGQVYFGVVHPDGTVTASWDKRERVLFKSRRHGYGRVNKVQNAVSLGID